MHDFKKLRRLHPLLWALVFLCAVLLLGVVYFQLRHEVSAGLAPLDYYGAAPEFRLINQDEKEIRLENLKGVVWIVDFIFTRCQGPCPLLSARMAQLGEAVKVDKGIKLVSVTVDPEHDTPQVLKEYAKRFAANPQQWTFLTGSKDKIEAFMVKGMLQPIIRAPTEGLIHSTQLVLVDSQGQIRAFRDGTSPQTVAQLLTDIRSLKYEASQHGRKMK
ncbi:MAG: SCO family protein [Verrucomicrobia bacterium]|nr:MAG: SCO family protein [Verrucomicrobiota bacterium]